MALVALAMAHNAKTLAALCPRFILGAIIALSGLLTVWLPASRVSRSPNMDGPPSLSGDATEMAAMEGLVEVVRALMGVLARAYARIMPPYRFPGLPATIEASGGF